MTFVLHNVEGLSPGSWFIPAIPDSVLCVQYYDGVIKMIIPSLHEGSSEENTQGGLSSGGPPLGQ